MDGELTIESRPGEGTVFRLTLPRASEASKGIAHCIVVDVRGQLFAIAAGNVREIVKPGEGDVSTIMGASEMIRVRGSSLPLFRLGDVFWSDGATPSDGLVIVLESGGGRKAVLVDDVVGERHVVVRSFERFGEFFDIRLFSGIALVGEDSAVAVDLENLFLEAETGYRCTSCRLAVA
jgi:two-component system chemotaxis sensor kinase CheA